MKKYYFLSAISKMVFFVICLTMVTNRIFAQNSCISSSPNFCGQDSISLTAPPGQAHYYWTGPIGGISGNDTIQTIWIDSTGTYTVVITPFAGPSDTLTITIGKVPGPPPVPTFTANAVCAGTPTQFINTSDSTHGIFSWDFYNLGIYNYTDTNNFNPTWTYVNHGIYIVKLNEILSNGCGASVYDTIVIDTNVTNASFTTNLTCFGDSTLFSSTAIGVTSYHWNFGDPTSGIHDSSRLQNPGHLFTSAGTYTLTLFANNQGNCGDSVSQIITIYAMPTPQIRAKDSICPGTRDTLHASGGTTYTWLPSFSNNPNLPAAPTVTETFTLEAFNGTCEKDTTFTIHVIPSPIPVASASKDTVCMGDTITLFGHGGTVYSWTKGSTSTQFSTDSTVHNVRITSDTTFKLYEYGATCEDSISISISLIPAITASISATPDTICQSDSATLTVIAIGGSATYQWSNGATTSTIHVSPSLTTSYNVTVYGICNSVQEFETVFDTCITTSFREIKSTNPFDIFPNPSTGQFTLSLSNVPEKCNVEVYNVLGERVYSSNYSLTTNHYSLDLSSQPSGIYLYRVITSNGGLVGEGKVVVQK